MTPKSDPSASAPLRVAVLGGGQLAQMLVLAAGRLPPHLSRPLGPLVLIAESETDPAALVASSLGVEIRLWAGMGQAMHAERSSELRAVLRDVDCCLFENEWIDVAAWRACGAQAGAEPRSATRPAAWPEFWPRLESLERWRDKLEQKRALHSLGIPTAPWVEWESEHTPGSAAWDREWKRWIDSLPWPAVLKWSLYGYDGKGTWLGDLQRNDAERTAARAFVTRGLARGARVFAEQRADIERELAITAVRTRTGGFGCYPLVESEQTGGVCRWVRGPVSAFGVAEETEARARAAAQAIPLEGVYALEFFLCRGSGALWVNELAPRVHNTTHYSMEAMPGADQFDAQLRAAFDPEWSPEAIEESWRRAGSPAFLMLNLLGGAGVQSLRAAPLHVAREGSGGMHWYGKRESRPGRKLGHATRLLGPASALRVSEARARARLLTLEQDWLLRATTQSALVADAAFELGWGGGD